MSLFLLQRNLNLIYVLIYWFLNIFIRLCIYLNFDDFFSISKKSSAQNEYIYIIYLAISNLLSGFLILYIKLSMRRKTKTHNKDKTKLIYKNPLKYRDKYFYLKLILISFLDLLHYSCYFIFFLIEKNATNEDISVKSEKDIKTLLDIIIRYIFSICILKTRVYKHHKWTIIAIIIGFLLVVPFDFVNIFLKININTKVTLKYISILSLRALFFPLEHTLIKQFYSDYYILPENLLFFMGIIQSIFLGILTPILIATKVLYDDLDFNTLKIIMSIIYTLISFVKQYITLKIIYLFSSQSVSFLIISTSIAGSINDIIGFFRTKDKGSIQPYIYVGFVLGLIALFIIIIATLVYDEILIIKKWGLDLNVKSGIIERSLTEIENTIEYIEGDNKTDITEEINMN